MSFDNYFINRGYELIIGDYKNDPNNAILIDNLQVTFEISKSISNKKRTNSATIEIYNLPEEAIALLDKQFIVADFKAGYYNTEIKRLFAGQVVSASTRKDRVDVVTQIKMGAGYSDLHYNNLNKTVAPGKTCKDVYEEVRKGIPGVDRGVYSGLNANNPVIDGYPLSSNPYMELNKLCQATDTDWQIDNNVLYVGDKDKGWMTNEGEAILISPETGLLNYAYKVAAEGSKKKQDPAKVAGIQFKANLNASLIPGSIVKIEQDDKAIDGFYIINSARFTGSWNSGGWEVDCRCGKKL